MSEFSYPRLNQDVTLAQWGNLAKAFGTGILDEGGNPYFITNKDSVNNTITIGVDSQTGYNSAVISGFFHFMDTAMNITIPAVTTDTTYEIGLRHDPNSTDPSGTIKLTSWVAPADESNGKNYIVLWRVFRKPEVSLANSATQEVRNRKSTITVVTRVSDLPSVQNELTDSIAFVRENNSFYRLANNGTDPMSWIAISSNIEVRSIAENPDTIPLRTGSGSVRGANPTHANDLVPRQWLLDNYWPRSEASGGIVGSANMLVKRGADMNFLVPSPSHGNHPATKDYVDGKNWRGEDITSGTVPYARIGGSTWAYDRIQSGQVYTVSVNSSGQFMRFSSAEKYKTDIEEWLPEYDKLLAVKTYTYRRLNEDGTVNPKVEIGVIADYNEELIPELVEYGPNGEIEGWSYNTWTVAHQKMLQVQHEEIAELKNENATLKANYDDLLARVSKLEGNA